MNQWTNKSFAAAAASDKSRDDPMTNPRLKSLPSRIRAEAKDYVNSPRVRNRGTRFPRALESLDHDELPLTPRGRQAARVMEQNPLDSPSRMNPPPAPRFSRAIASSTTANSAAKLPFEDLDTQMSHRTYRNQIESPVKSSSRSERERKGRIKKNKPDRSSEYSSSTRQGNILPHEQHHNSTEKRLDEHRKYDFNCDYNYQDNDNDNQYDTKALSSSYSPRRSKNNQDPTSNNVDHHLKHLKLCRTKSARSISVGTGQHRENVSSYYDDDDGVCHGDNPHPMRTVSPKNSRDNNRKFRSPRCTENTEKRDKQSKTRTKHIKQLETTKEEENLVQLAFPSTSQRNIETDEQVFSSRKLRRDLPPQEQTSRCTAMRMKKKKIKNNNIKSPSKCSKVKKSKAKTRQSEEHSGYESSPTIDGNKTHVSAQLLSPCARNRLLRHPSTAESGSSSYSPSNMSTANGSLLRVVTARRNLRHVADLNQIKSVLTPTRPTSRPSMYPKDFVDVDDESSLNFGLRRRLSSSRVGNVSHDTQEHRRVQEHESSDDNDDDNDDNSRGNNEIKKRRSTLKLEPNDSFSQSQSRDSHNEFMDSWEAALQRLESSQENSSNQESVREPADNNDSLNHSNPSRESGNTQAFQFALWKNAKKNFAISDGVKFPSSNSNSEQDNDSTRGHHTKQTGPEIRTCTSKARNSENPLEMVFTNKSTTKTKQGGSMEQTERRRNSIQRADFEHLSLDLRAVQKKTDHFVSQGFGETDNDDDGPSTTSFRSPVPFHFNEPVSFEEFDQFQPCTSSSPIRSSSSLSFSSKSNLERDNLPRAPVKWRRGEMIGEGTFGKVFMGLNDLNGELFAVKQIEIPWDRRGTSQNRLERLEEEISLMEVLDHHHIVRYRGTDRDETHFYIFLEYVPGGSIASMLSRFGVFNEDLIRLYTRQILEGVKYLHSKGIIHRDIKGANVLVNEHGVAKLADFGCSKQLRTVRTKSVEESLRAIRGSVPWMAPEVIKQTGHGFKADIWSVGATVIEMASAAHPWPGYTNNLSVMYNIAMTTTSPPIPETLSSEVSRSFLEQCFRIDPEQRSSAAELLEHPFLAMPNQ